MKPLTPKQIALDVYAESVITKCERLLTGGDDLPADMRPDVAQSLMKHRDWIAQEQVAAFEFGVSTDECARWIVQNIRNMKARTN